jgi:hypothetical protein
MNELEILNNILINEVYKDKLLLELELDKVDDRLSIGLLTELLVKDGYEADKDLIKGVLATRVDDNDLTECHNLFIKEIVEFRKTIKRVDPNVIGKSLVLFRIILDMSKVNDGVLQESELSKSELFVTELKSSSKEQLDYFKELLILSEKYEILTEIDKIL